MNFQNWCSSNEIFFSNLLLSGKIIVCYCFTLSSSFVKWRGKCEICHCIAFKLDFQQIFLSKKCFFIPKWRGMRTLWRLMKINICKQFESIWKKNYFTFFFFFFSLFFFFWVKKKNKKMANKTCVFAVCILVVIILVSLAIFIPILLLGNGI